MRRSTSRQQRLERIRKNIKNCTLHAPTDGIVVYVNQTNRFGMVTAPIAEGVTVRQDQPIINLPDPLHMRVKARINESKLSLVQTGQAGADRGRRLSRPAAQRPRRRSDRDQHAVERLGRPRLLRQRRHRSRDSRIFAQV